jgi:hypothetical protein
MKSADALKVLKSEQSISLTISITTHLRGDKNILAMDVDLIKIGQFQEEDDDDKLVHRK